MDSSNWTSLQAMGIPPLYSWRRASLGSTARCHSVCHDHSKPAITGERMLLALHHHPIRSTPSNRPLALVSPYPSFTYLLPISRRPGCQQCSSMSLVGTPTKPTSTVVHYSHLLSLLSLTHFPILPALLADFPFGPHPLASDGCGRSCTSCILRILYIY